VLGVLVVPAALVAIFNSYATPDFDAIVRMAFAQVAGAAIAMATVVALFAHVVLRREPRREIVWIGIIAVAVIVWQISNLSGAADLLLTRLGIYDISFGR
jgi:hypothetical protein